MQGFWFKYLKAFILMVIFFSPILLVYAWRVSYKKVYLAQYWNFLSISWFQYQNFLLRIVCRHGLGSVLGSNPFRQSRACPKCFAHVRLYYIKYVIYRVMLRERQMFRLRLRSHCSVFNRNRRKTYPFLPCVHTAPIWKRSVSNTQTNTDTFEYGGYWIRSVCIANNENGDI